MGAQNAGSVGRGFLAYPAYPRPFSGQAAEQVPDAICLVCAMQAQPPQAGETRRCTGSTVCGPDSALATLPAGARTSRHFWGASIQAEEGQTLDPSCSIVSSGLRARPSHSNGHCVPWPVTGSTNSQATV